AAIAENRIAGEVAGVLLGGAGVTAVSVGVLLSPVGCVNGLILGGARVLFAMARDGVFFEMAGNVDARWHTPRGALGLQAVWSCVLAVSGSYDRLLTYVTFASLAFNALTVAGVFVLRAKRPGLPRPYRTLGYPLTPDAYLVCAALVLAY